MTLLGYERGESAATMPIMFRYEMDKLIDLVVKKNKILRLKFASG